MTCHGDMALLRPFHEEKQTSLEEEPNFSFETVSVSFWLQLFLFMTVKLSYT